MSATQKRNSDTDLFFIIESLTIYFEKILEIMDEPLKNYSKTEWFKFKELLTSPDLSPCKCFSYANSLKLVKPQPVVKVATFNLGDLGDQQSTISQPQSNQQSVTQTPVLTLKKQEPSITVPSLISLSTVSPPNNFQKQYSFNTSKVLIENKEQEQKKTKNSILNIQSVQQTTQPQTQPQNGNSSNQQNLLSPPPQTYFTAQSQPHFNYSNQVSINSISGSPSKIQSSAQTQTNISTSQAGKSSHSTSNQSSLGNNNYLNGGSTSYNNQNVKQIQQTLQNISSIGISSASQNQTGASNRIHSISINSANNQSSLNYSTNPSNTTTGAAGSNLNNNNSSSNNYAVDERLRSPQLNSSNQNSIYLSKTSARNQATSASRLKNKNQISVSNLSNLQVSSKKSPSQLEKLVSSTKVPQAHMKAQKSLQIDIKENSFQSRNHLQSNPSVISSTSTRVDLSKVNQNSIGNLLSTSKNLTGSPQYITSSTNYGNYNSHLLSSIGSSQNGYANSASKGLTNNSSSKRFEGLSMTDRIRDKPQMNSIKTESVLIENSPPNHNSNTDNSSNGNFNNASPENKQNQNPLTFTSSTSNSILNLGLQQVPQNNIVQIQQQVIQEQPQNESIGSPSNTPITTIGIDHPPIRKRARRETRKLSLEKFQNNIDAIQRQSELEENGITPILPLAHNKGFQQVLMNRLDIMHSPNNNLDKKRDPSPVNNRIGCDKIQGIHDFQKFKSDEQETVKENPYKHLLQKVQQRINVFLMDSKTLELISGKFTDVEETKRHREQANKQGAAVNFQSAHNNVNGGVQERQEIKRDKLKKYSVFAKKGQDQYNLKRVDDQISKDEQKLVNPLIKQRKRDEKKKLIM
ncbi:hypothetical protein ABPG74_012377 [Tetrahymena malaccensis]